MEELYITHYFYPGTDPWKNIMNLPEQEAFRVAAELADKHKDTTSFGRFSDFANYYPDRKRADEYVREEFIKLGGRPELKHPYSFVLGECEYLRNWFDTNDKIVLALSDIPDEQISFTLGDSCALLIHGEEPVVLTKAMLLDEISACDGSVEEYCKKSLGRYAYIEVQLWADRSIYRREKMDYRTDKLILHYVTEEDLAEVMRTWPSDHSPLSEEEAEGVISYLQSNCAKNIAGSIFHLCLAVCAAEDPDTIMGWCGLDGSKSHTEPEIFILLDEEYRNKGYGTECVNELLRTAVEDFSLQSVHGGCAKDNIASYKAMEKGGMVCYGTEENGDPLFRYTVKGEDGSRE